MLSVWEVVGSKPGWWVFMDNYEIWELDSHISNKKKIYAYEQNVYRGPDKFGEVPYTAKKFVKNEITWRQYEEKRRD
jgi:hypothetical protein